METFCPASMCPLFAPKGSPWTGNFNSKCPQKPAYVRGKETDMSGCGFFNEIHNSCEGVGCASLQVKEAKEHGNTFQIGPVQMDENKNIVPGKVFECSRSDNCQWQVESGEDLCPPRQALLEGIDPRAVAF